MTAGPKQAPMAEVVLAVTPWRSNAEMIADVARLGYLDGHVLDPTYGLGNWWTVWKPNPFTCHDLRHDGVDFRRLPHPPGTFDTVAFDPPYKLNGTPSDADIPYGVDDVDTREGRHNLIRQGITECARVLKPGGFLLVKCQDQVEGGKVRWQSRMFAEHGESLGLAHVDAFLFLAYRPQPSDRRQVHARRNYSTLLILQAPKVWPALTTLAMQL